MVTGGSRGGERVIVEAGIARNAVEKIAFCKGAASAKVLRRKDSRGHSGRVNRQGAL